MKRLILLLLMSVTILSLAQAQYGRRNRSHQNVNFNIFYSSLSPYGEWVEVSYGRVWRPLHVAHHWRPYLYGRWMWTNYGWYWYSDEPFGWATFHYGRWAYDDYYGWIWIPGDQWGPAWVEWRYDNDYIGWAPLPPQAHFSINVGISFSNHWVAPVHYWSFVPCHSFTSVRLVDYVQPVERNRRIVGSTRGVVNIRSERDMVVNRGIDVGFVERRGKVRVNRVDVVTRDRGDAGERYVREPRAERVEVYRPRLDGRDRIGETRSRETDRRDQSSLDRGTRDRDVSTYRNAPEQYRRDTQSRSDRYSSRNYRERNQMPQRSKEQYRSQVERQRTDQREELEQRQNRNSERQSQQEIRRKESNQQRSFESGRRQQGGGSSREQGRSPSVQRGDQRTSGHRP